MLKKQTKLLTFTSHSNESSNCSVIYGLLYNQVLFKMNDSNLFIFKKSFFFKFMLHVPMYKQGPRQKHTTVSNKALQIQRQCRVVRLRQNFTERLRVFHTVHLIQKLCEFCVSLHTLLPTACARSRQLPRSAPVFTSANGYLQVTADSGRDFFFKQTQCGC